MIDALDKLAPEKANYRHNAEGSDDMVSPPTYQHLFGVLTLVACTYKVGSYGDECEYTYFGRQVGVGDMAGDISLRVQEKCSSKNVGCYYPGRTVILLRLLVYVLVIQHRRQSPFPPQNRLIIIDIRH